MEYEQTITDKRARNYICKYCNKRGHFSKNCRNKPVKNTMTKEQRNVCLKCKQKGHYKKNCPQLTGEERKKYNRTTKIDSEITSGITDVDMNELIGKTEIRLNIAQAMKYIPGLRQEFHEKTKGKRVSIQTNFLENNGNSRAMTCKGQIDEHGLYVIIDTGAARSVMSKGLANELGINIIRKNGETYNTANGRIASIGEVRGIQVFLEGEETNVDFKILDSDDKIMLLEMDWMRVLRNFSS